MATIIDKKLGFPDGFYPAASILLNNLWELKTYINLQKPAHLGVEVKDGVAKLVLAGTPKVEEESKVPEKSVTLEAPPPTGEFVGLKNKGKITKVEVFPTKKFSDGMPMIPSKKVLDGYNLKDLKAFMRNTLGFEQMMLFRMRRSSCENLIEWSRKNLEDYWVWKDMQTDD